MGTLKHIVQIRSAAEWMWHHRSVSIGLVGLSLGLVVVPLLIPPILGAVELGGDEHFEVTKGLLLSRGLRLYDPVWNDQPPLFTFLLAGAFQFVGPSIGTARLLALGFAALLYVELFVLVRRGAGLLAATVAVFSFVCAPHILELSVTAMLEVPAFAIGLGALLPRWTRTTHAQDKTCRVVLSGAIMAFALQTKLTSALLCPALLLEVAGRSRNRGGAQHLRAIMRSWFLWFCTVGGLYFALGFCLGVDHGNAWVSHSEIKPWAASAVAQHAFSPTLLLAVPENLCGAALGCFILMKKEGRQTMQFPAVLLVTVSLIHSVHRPYWYYYFLHFALPMGWLTGASVGWLFRSACLSRPPRAWLVQWKSVGQLLLASLLVSAVLSNGFIRAGEEIARVRSVAGTRGNEVVEKMKLYGRETRWVYTRFTSYPFHVGLLVIPELAVMPLKRFWSGQMDEGRLLGLLRRYEPEQVLLSNGEFTTEAEQWIRQEYVSVYRDMEVELFLAKKLGPVARDPNP